MICGTWQQSVSNSTANIMAFPWYSVIFMHMISTRMLNAQKVNNIQILWPIPYSATEALHPVSVKFTRPPMKAPFSLKILDNQQVYMKIWIYYIIVVNLQVKATFWSHLQGSVFWKIYYDKQANVQLKDIKF
jgi:hypothetical protein